MTSTSYIGLITGPFGTGKTIFLALLTRVLSCLGKEVLIYCSSVAVIDTLVQKIEATDPLLKAIRFHSIFTDTNAVKIEATASVERRLLM